MSKTPPRRFGLSRRHTRRKARDFVDQDYLEKLTPAELDFLDKFNREFYQSQFTNTRKDLHRTQEAKRECYGANNARQRDMWHQFHRMPFDLTDAMPDDEDDDK